MRGIWGAVIVIAAMLTSCNEPPEGMGDPLGPPPDSQQSMSGQSNPSGPGQPVVTGTGQPGVSGSSQPTVSGQGMRMAGGAVGQNPAASKALSPTEPVSEAEAREFAIQVVQSVANEDRSAEKFFDMDRIMSRITGPLGLSPRRLEVLNSMFASTFSNMNPVMMQANVAVKTGGEYKMIRARQKDGEMRVLFRVLRPGPEKLGERVDYHDFLLVKSGGKVRAMDVFIYSDGEDLSTSESRDIGMTYADDEPELLQRIFDTEEDHADEYKKLDMLLDSMSKQHLKEIVPTYQSLPEELRKDAKLTLVAVEAAIRQEDFKLAEKLVGELRKNHPENPAADMIGMSLSAARRDYAGAIAACERINTAVGGDGQMYMMIANMYIKSKKYEEAKKAAEEGVKIEPDHLKLRMTQAAVAAASGDHKGALEMFKKVHTDLNAPLNLDYIRKSSEFGKFGKSPEYKELKKFVGQ